MPSFKTWDSSGASLVDSDYISMGLVKSGYMQRYADAQRSRRIYLNNDTYYPAPYFDAIHGFSVSARAPLVFISGRGVLQTISRDGNIFTYRYAHASEMTRFYVFDLMEDKGAVGAKLRLWDALGVCTLDSGMPFLDINGSAKPPGPDFSSNSSIGGKVYDGAAVSTEKSIIGPGAIDSGMTDILINSHSIHVGGDCAASAPWSRGLFHYGISYGSGVFGARDGAYGDGPNLVFIAATEAGCAVNLVADGGGAARYGYVPRPRVPEATYIDASMLPIPYSANS